MAKRAELVRGQRLGPPKSSAKVGQAVHVAAMGRACAPRVAVLPLRGHCAGRLVVEVVAVMVMVMVPSTVAAPLWIARVQGRQELGGHLEPRRPGSN